MKRLAFGVLITAALCAASCRSDTPATAGTSPNDSEAGDRTELTGAPIILSILPVESATTMYKRFLPLKYYLEKTLKLPVVITIAKDYETAMSGIGSGQVHLACLDPATYCEVRARYKGRVTPLVRTVSQAGAASRSVLVTKRGSGIAKLVDVKGRRLALGSKQSSFSYLIPLAMLHDVGIGIKDFSSVGYLQQEERVALSVLIGNYDVGAMSESVARKFAENGLVTIKASEAIPRCVLCSSASLTPALRTRIRDLLSAEEGRQIVPPVIDGVGAFVPAADRDFDVVRVMIKNLTGKDYIEYGPKTIKVAILPLYSAITLYDRYEPLMRYLSRKTGYEFKLVVPRDFDDFIDIVRHGQVDFSYQNPYVFARIDKEVDIQPLVTTVGEDTAQEDGAGTDSHFRGVIITRHDSTIKDINALREKKVLITSPMSAGGYLSQRLFLLQRGIDPERDMAIIDAKRQENVILGVYWGEADAGFVRESALVVWKDVVDMSKIRVLARTEPLPNWPFALCRANDAALVKAVTRLLTGLDDPQILRSARIKRFVAADEAELEALKRY